MVLFTIILFFVLLFVFFVVSGMWHWVWFGRGAGVLADRLTPWFFPREKERQAAALKIETAVKVTSVGLLVAVMLGLFLTIYWLLAF